MSRAELGTERGTETRFFGDRPPFLRFFSGYVRLLSNEKRVSVPRSVPSSAPWHLLNLTTLISIILYCHKYIKNSKNAKNISK